MNDGGAVSYGLKLATNSFAHSEVQLLWDILDRKYADARIKSAGAANQYLIHIPSSSMPILASIVGPFIHPSMQYKSNGHL
jgi:hypothetical protein